MLNLPQHVQLPGLLGAGLVAQALERDANFHVVATRYQPPLGGEDEVGTQVRALPRPHTSAAETAAAGDPALHQHAIPLHAQRIDGEHERLAAIVERAQEDLYIVVGEDPVTVGQIGVYLSMRLTRANPEVNGARRVPHPHLGRVDGGHAIDRLEVGEPSKDRRAAPCRLVQHPVYHRLCVETGN